MIAESAIGEPVDIEVLRKRKRRTLTATIERLEEDVTKSSGASGDEDEADIETAMGIQVEALSEAVRRDNKIKSEIKGVRVVKVSSKSPAAGKILSGDIIEKVAFEDVTSPDEFEAALTSAQEFNRPVTILVNRGGNYLFYALDIS
jgi:serine protease Do